MDAICHDRLPVCPWMEPRLAGLPGVVPIDGGDWLRADEAYGAQMALRRALIAKKRDAVHALAPGARGPAEELLDSVLTVLPGLGFEVAGTRVHCPDGESMAVDRKNPLITLGRLVQNDFCLLEKRGAEHVLTGAILCFPASWTLAEKFGHPLVRIHAPVAPYDDGVAARVQRLFDGVKPGRGLWRMNALLYDDPGLYQPRRMARPRVRRGDAAPYVRCERQTIIRLPRTGAVVFGIHIYQVPRNRLSAEEEAALRAAGLAHAGDP